jgi:hypothetical protein
MEKTADQQSPRRRRTRTPPRSGDEPWRCPGCRATLSTRYCPSCGESRLRPRDLTMRGLLEQAVEAVASIESRLLRSLRSFVTRPGLLTTAYLQGRRKPYILPLQLFLVANVMFFALQSLTGVKVFSTPLAMQGAESPATWSRSVSRARSEPSSNTRPCSTTRWR